MTCFEALILGIVQGLTEFLPISSKSHLALAQMLLEGRHPAARAGLGFTVLLHLPSLLAVLWAYRTDLVRYATRALQPGDGNAPVRREVSWLVLATIPAGAAGFLLEKRLDAWLQRPLYIGIGLLGTALLLGASERWAGDRDDAEKLGPLRSLGIGLLQACAILPGISRSGSTISAGLFAGLRRSEAVRFSFLLSIPVVAGACLLKGLKGELYQAEWGALPIALGTVSCFLTSLAAIHLVRRLARGRSLVYFSVYCAVLGTAVILWDVGAFPH